MNYLVYKNGKGQAWANLTAELNLFYVGFGSHFDALGNTTASSGIQNAKDLSKHIKQDMQHILLACHRQNRAQFILLTFERNDLVFWKISGGVAEHPVGSSVWTKAKEIFQGFTPNLQQVYKHYFFGEGRSFRTLPVTEVARVPRTALYTSIDSLSVYQYLNRGTCRPMWRINGPTGAPPFPCKPSNLNTLYSGNSSKETPYASFIRRYLNDILFHYAPKTASADTPRLSQLPDLDYEALVLSTMNPILVETAAFAFCQDLGLIADIGIGKGMDVVDIRARAADSEGRFSREVASSALSRLQQFGVKISPLLQNRLLQEGTLDIQCKAAHRDDIPEGILYFGYKAKRFSEQDCDTLLIPSLQSLLRQPGTSQFSRFVNLQASVLSGQWKRSLTSRAVDAPPAEGASDEP